MREHLGVMVAEASADVRYLPEQNQFSVTVHSGKKTAEFRYTPEQFLATSVRARAAVEEFLAHTGADPIE